MYLRNAIRYLIAIFVMFCIFPASLAAQTSGPPTPPNVELTDENFVNLASGDTEIPIFLVKIGGADFALSFTGTAITAGVISRTSLEARLDNDQRCGFSMRYSGLSDYYSTCSSGNVPAGSERATTNGGLFRKNWDGSYTTTFRDGTVVDFQASTWLPLQARSPTGKTRRFTGWSYPASGPGTAGSIMQNNGLLLKHYTDGRVIAINLAYEYCDPNPDVYCSPTLEWPSARIETLNIIQSPAIGRANFDTKITDMSGRVHFMRSVQGQLVGYYDNYLLAPSSVRSYQRCTYVPVVCYFTVCNNQFTCQNSDMYDRVIGADRRSNHWSANYIWNTGPYSSKYILTSPEGARSALSFAPQGSPSYMSRFSDIKAIYDFDSYNRVRIVTFSEGNYDYYQYDTRSNIISVSHGPKTNSAQSVVTETASYDASCANRATCNQPNYSVDANGGRTDYTYDAVTGQPLTVSYPAVNGIRKVVRYQYAWRRAWYLNASGAYVPDALPISLLVTEKTCLSSATVGDVCAQSGDEQVITYDYGPDSGPNNLWLRGRAVQADGQVLRTCYTYDRLGNLVSTTSPRAGLSTCS